MATRKENRERLLHDRAQLVAALRDYQDGKWPDLSETELLSFIESVERRLAVVDRKLGQTI